MMGIVVLGYAKYFFLMIIDGNEELSQLHWLDHRILHSVLITFHKAKNIGVPFKLVIVILCIILTSAFFHDYLK